MSHNFMKDSELNQILNWRYAVKKFDSSRKLPAEKWESLAEVLRLTPSSYGLQTWKFLIVQNPELRKALRAASWGQSQVEDCSQYVVFTARKTIDESYIRNYAKRMSEVRGVPVESLDKFVAAVVGDVISGPRGAMASEWMARQCYIALGNLMTSAAILGVDTCPMEGLDPKKYDQILGLENSEYRTIVACAVGYRHSDDKYQAMKKVRFETSDVLKTL